MHGTTEEFKQWKQSWEKKTKTTQGCVLQDMKFYYKAMAIKIVQYWHNKQRKEINLSIYGQLTYDKEAKNTQWRNTIISLINFVGKTGSHMQKNENGPLSNTIHKK